MAHRISLFALAMVLLPALSGAAPRLWTVTTAPSASYSAPTQSRRTASIRTAAWRAKAQTGQVASSNLQMNSRMYKVQPGSSRYMRNTLSASIQASLQSQRQTYRPASTRRTRRRRVARSPRLNSLGVNNSGYSFSLR